MYFCTVIFLVSKYISTTHPLSYNQLNYLFFRRRPAAMSESEKEMSCKCLERKGAAATMETQRGAKAPLVSSLSPDLPLCFPRRWMGTRSSPWLFKTCTRIKASPEKPVWPLVSSNPLSLITQPGSSFPFSSIIPSFMTSAPLRHPVSVLFEMLESR